MELRLDGEVWYWRGPAPFHFVTVPPPVAGQLRQVLSRVTYGWATVPAEVTLGGTTWTTSLWPEEGGYVAPLEAAVRRAGAVEVGDHVGLRLVPDL